MNKPDEEVFTPLTVDEAVTRGEGAGLAVVVQGSLGLRQ